MLRGATRFAASTDDPWKTGTLTEEELQRRRLAGAWKSRRRNPHAPPKTPAKDRLGETDWKALTLELVRADARRMVEAEADSLGLEGGWRKRHMEERMAAQEGALAHAAALHVENVEAVLRWDRVRCGRCGAEQWAKTLRPLAEGEEPLTGGPCEQCGRRVDERIWVIVPLNDPTPLDTEEDEGEDGGSDEDES